MNSSKVVRVSGVTVDITDRKEAEERQALLAREVDHRAKNALALVQSIIRLTRAGSMDGLYRGRLKAASRRCRALIRCWRSPAGKAPTSSGLVEEELAPFRTSDAEKIVVQGPPVLVAADPGADAGAGIA